MAILKHIASKSSNYGAALEYLIFKHDELRKTLILDQNGNRIMRDEYYLDGLNCEPYSFDAACQQLNREYQKNKNKDEIKSHHYILSFDPNDKDEHGLTGERAQQLGLEYAKKNFPGHQALVCTHTDGHNGSGNIHVHIVINSLRKFDVERQDFMERPCDSLAGNKHHLTKKYLIHLKQEVMDMCRRENLNQVDLLTPAERKITEKEYWANRRGQEKLDTKNQRMIADGVTPRNTKFQTQKQFLRDSIDSAVSSAHTLEEFQKILSEKYGILIKESRGRFSYLHPERTKPITGRNLGTHYEKNYLLQVIGNNVKCHDEEVVIPVQQAAIAAPEMYAAQNSSIPHETAFAILFIKSDLHLVTDLQNCVKAQQNAAYARKVKLSNLKEMAKTVAYVQEHGYDSLDALETSFSSVKEHTDTFRKNLKSTERDLREINEQLHYTGQYLANKAIYTKFCQSKNKGVFRKEHSAEIALYETARKFLKEKSGNIKLPSMKLLKEKKEELLKQKKSAQEQYQYYRDYQKELNTVRSNINSILGKEYPHQKTHTKEQTLT